MKVRFIPVKKLNRLAALFLAVVLCLSTTTAFANTIDNDNELLNRGYPLALINKMTDEEKEDLINDDCYYEDSVIYNYDENGDLISIQSFDENAVTPYGQIKTAHLKLTFTVSKSGSNTVVTFNYDWKVLPVNRYQDPIGVAWDSNVFSMKSGSFRKVDKYIAAYLDGSNGSYTGTHSDESAFAKSGTGYVTWYADLKGYSNAVIGLFGYGKFTLVPKTQGKSTQIFGHYVHSKLSTNLSLSYGGASFSVSGGSNYDELGAERTLVS